MYVCVFVCVCERERERSVVCVVYVPMWHPVHLPEVVERGVGCPTPSLSAHSYLSWTLTDPGACRAFHKLWQFSILCSPIGLGSQMHVAMPAIYVGSGD